MEKETILKKLMAMEKALHAILYRLEIIETSLIKLERESNGCKCDH